MTIVAVAVAISIYAVGNSMAPRPAPLAETEEASMDSQRNAELNKLLEGCLDNLGTSNEIIFNSCNRKLSIDNINQICTLEDPRYDICQPEGLRDVQTYREIAAVFQ